MAETPISPNEYQGKKVIINSDRLLYNAKTDNILIYSSQNISFSCNGNIHFDSVDEGSQMVVNTENIYLGLDGDKFAHEPAVLGNKNEKWLIDLITSIEDLIFILGEGGTYTLITTLPGAPTAPNPANTGILAQVKSKLGTLKTTIEDIKSKRVKVV